MSTRRGYSTRKPNFLSKVLGSVAAGIITLNAGAALTLNNSAGASVWTCDEFGACSMSGSLTVQGVTLSTGSVLTAGDADGLYVNEGGDTATGAYVFADTLEVQTTLSGASIRANHGQILVERTSITFPVYASGATTGTGVNVFGDYEIPVDGTFVAAFANLGTTADDNTTEVDVLIDGTTIFSTTLTIDSTEKSSRTAATPAVINTSADDFTAGDLITIDVNSPATNPGSQLFVTLTFDKTITP